MKLHLAKQLNKVDFSVIPVYTEEKLSKLKAYGLASEIIDLTDSDFGRKLGELHMLYTPQLGRLLLLGLGNKKDLTPARLRTAIQTAILGTKKFKPSSLQIILWNHPGLQSQEFLELISFASMFGAYSFDYYRQEEKSNLANVFLVVSQISKTASAAVAAGSTIGQAANQARDLANHPANIATPAHLAAHAKSLAQKYNLRIRVLEERDMKKEGMGLLLGVSRGSDEPPKFIVVEHGPKSKNPIVLIGKGLTFDSGGISIKPSERMEEMKYDMCGGATVLGILQAAAMLKLKIPLVGLIPSSENLLSGRATKPGDVLTSLSGKTVEIINTDAEGRLILADAITYAKKHYQPKLIMDYATLTGAIIVALGDEFTGVFANLEKYHQSVFKASRATGEKLWLMPLPEEYQDQLKSNIADLKNTGEKGLGGAITASLFLSRFVEQTPWMHFDIAGTAWTMRARPHLPVGATGWGVYHAIHFLSSLK
ncbi:MAG: leucyl aminopeptidase [Candidatus Doudnabacteria bacterium]|nr:leucyl aminopeptidase [Candidatus Doudnabacteria bacterium]